MTLRQRIDAAQLPLPFHPSPIARLSEEDRTATLTVLAQLLLAAVGADPKEAEDER